jgi:hypothetical protein
MLVHVVGKVPSIDGVRGTPFGIERGLGYKNATVNAFSFVRIKWNSLRLASFPHESVSPDGKTHPT